MSQRIVQWMSKAGPSGVTDEHEGFGLSPVTVKVVSGADFDKAFTDNINLLKSAANASRAASGRDSWCDSSILESMGSNLGGTQHMIVVADTTAGVGAGAGGRTPASLHGILTMGRDTIHGDPPTGLTIYGACAKTPDHLLALLGGLIAADRLKTYGITQVKATVLPQEVLVYVRAGFRVVPGGGGAIVPMILGGSTGGKRRKSKSVRTKRKRMTRRNRLKQ